MKIIDKYYTIRKKKFSNFGQNITLKEKCSFHHFNGNHSFSKSEESSIFIKLFLKKTKKINFPPLIKLEDNTPNVRILKFSRENTFSGNKHTERENANLGDHSLGG